MRDTITALLELWGQMTPLRGLGMLIGLWGIHYLRSTPESIQKRQAKLEALAGGPMSPDTFAEFRNRSRRRDLGILLALGFGIVASTASGTVSAFRQQGPEPISTAIGLPGLMLCLLMITAASLSTARMTSNTRVALLAPRRERDYLPLIDLVVQYGSICFSALALIISALFIGTERSPSMAVFTAMVAAFALLIGIACPIIRRRLLLQPNAAADHPGAFWHNVWLSQTLRDVTTCASLIAYVGGGTAYLLVVNNSEQLQTPQLIGVLAVVHLMIGVLLMIFAVITTIESLRHPPHYLLQSRRPGPGLRRELSPA